MKKNHREEKRLVKLSIKGDKRALEALLINHLNFCFSIAVTLLEDQKIAENCIENTFKEVTENIKDLYNPEGFLVWLYEILIRNIELVKTKGKAVKSSFFDEKTDYEINYSTLIAFDDEEKKSLGRFLEKIRSFEQQEKAIFAMVDFEGLSASEVSVILGIDEMEVRRMLYRVKRELKQLFLEKRTGLFTIKNPLSMDNSIEEEVDEKYESEIREFFEENDNIEIKKENEII